MRTFNYEGELFSYEFTFMYQGPVIKNYDGYLNYDNVELEMIKVDIFNLDGTFISTTYLEPDYKDYNLDSKLVEELKKEEDRGYIDYINDYDRWIDQDELNADMYDDDGE